MLIICLLGFGFLGFLTWWKVKAIGLDKTLCILENNRDWFDESKSDQERLREVKKARRKYGWAIGKKSRQDLDNLIIYTENYINRKGEPK